MRSPLFALLVLFLTVLPAVVLAVDTTPVAPYPPETPYTHRYQTQQHRFLESETKSRLMAINEEVDQGRTANMELYDVVFYDLVMDLNPSSEILTGSTTVVAEVLEGSLNL